MVALGNPEIIAGPLSSAKDTFEGVHKIQGSEKAFPSINIIQSRNLIKMLYFKHCCKICDLQNGYLVAIGRCSTALYSWYSISSQSLISSVPFPMAKRDIRGGQTEISWQHVSLPYKASERGRSHLKNGNVGCTGRCTAWHSGGKPSCSSLSGGFQERWYRPAFLGWSTIETAS